MKNGFTFLPSKSTCIHFRRHYLWHNISLSLGGTDIPSVNSTTHLGMIFDQKLHWCEHINNLKHSCSQKLNIIPKLAHTSYGTETTSLINIYKATIQFKLDYGAAAYNSVSSSLL